MQIKRPPGGRSLLKIISSHGYVKVLVGKKKYEYEHRVVMSEYLGRSLRPNEDVHHINGNKQDNRIENLELVSHSNHSKRFANPPHKPLRQNIMIFCACGCGQMRWKYETNHGKSGGNYRERRYINHHGARKKRSV